MTYGGASVRSNRHEAAHPSGRIDMRRRIRQGEETKDGASVRAKTGVETLVEADNCYA